MYFPRFRLILGIPNSTWCVTTARFETRSVGANPSAGPVSMSPPAAPPYSGGLYVEFTRGWFLSDLIRKVFRYLADGFQDGGSVSRGGLDNVRQLLGLLIP